MPTNHHEQGNDAKAKGDFVDHPAPGAESAQLGYETTDVNAGGIVVFIGGLFGFVIIFFFFCFLMGRVINDQLLKQDGPTDKFHTQNHIFDGAHSNGGKREDLKSNAAIQQQELGQMANTFPGPQLQTDDGNMDTANLHAREDLLLEHYSSVPGQPIRIPIEHAMELIAQKGLPVAPAAQNTETLAGDSTPVVTVPLTNGFARTGYELTTIEARKQKMDFGKAEAAQHAELKPIK